MAWPPPVLPINRTNATPQLDTHAADHNAVNLAVNDITAVVKRLAPGYVTHHYDATEQSGISTAYINLNVRVDYVELTGHNYLYVFSAHLHKSDPPAWGDVQLMHSSGAQVGWFTQQMSVASPGVQGVTLLGMRSGFGGAPVNVIGQARCSAGFMNVSRQLLMVVDLGPHTP